MDMVMWFSRKGVHSLTAQIQGFTYLFGHVMQKTALGWLVILCAKN